MKKILDQSILSIWYLLCIITFISFPGKISYIHQTSLWGLQQFPASLVRIDFAIYAKDLIWALLGISLFSLSCLSLGSVFIGGYRKITTNSASSSLDYLALVGTSLIIGQSIFSIIFLTLAAVYKITPLYVIWILVLGFFLGIHQLFILIFKTSKNIKIFKKPTSPFDKLVVTLTIIILIASLLYTTSRLSYDAASFYFSIAKVIAVTNRIQFFQNSSLIVSSIQAGIQYAAIMQIFGDQAARMYSWSNGVTIIVLYLAIAKNVGLNFKARVIFTAMIVTSTAFLDIMGDGKIDLASTAPAVAAIYWLIISDKNKSSFVFILIGFFTGMAMIMRPFNVFLLGVFLTTYYLINFYERYKNHMYVDKPFFYSIFWVASGISILMIFHLLANWIILRDPLAPLSLIQFKEEDWHYSYDRNIIWGVRLLYPFFVTFVNSPQTLGNITPLVVAFVPNLLLRNIRRRMGLSKILVSILIAASISIISWIVLFFAVAEIRYVLFIWILFFIPLSEIIEKSLCNSGVLLQKTMMATIIFMLGITVLRIIFISINTYSPVDKQGTPHCYNSSLCDLLISVNGAAHRGDRVLVLNSYRYYLRPDLLTCSSKQDEYTTLQALSTQNSSNFWVEVYQQGYTFITYEKNYSEVFLGFDFISNTKNLPEWLSLEEIYVSPSGHQASYKIYVNQPPVSKIAACIQNKNEIWEVQE